MEKWHIKKNSENSLLSRILSHVSVSVVALSLSNKSLIHRTNTHSFVSTPHRKENTISRARCWRFSFLVEYKSFEGHESKMMEIFLKKKKWAERQEGRSLSSSCVELMIVAGELRPFCRLFIYIRSDNAISPAFLCFALAGTFSISISIL